MSKEMYGDYVIVNKDAGIKEQLSVVEEQIRQIETLAPIANIKSLEDYKLEFFTTSVGGKMALAWRLTPRDKELKFTNRELRKLAYALECRYGFGDDLAERIYEHLERTTGNDYRL